MRSFRGRKYKHVWVLWHGGSSYGLPELSTAEVLPGLREARAAFRRRFYNYPYPGEPLTPCVDDSATMRVYLVDPAELRDPYPEWSIEVKRSKSGKVSFPVVEC